LNYKDNPRFYRQRPLHEDIKWLRDTCLIWHPAEATYFEPPINGFCHFRKIFKLPDKPDKGELRIFADSRYMLFINGKYVGRGPCRSDPRWQYYDVLNVTPYLSAGRNIIAALALHYGYGTGQSIPRMPALVVEGRFHCLNGQKVSISSDGSWKCLRAPAYDRRAPRINGRQGPIEVYDARRSPSGWIEVNYDDQEWANAAARPLTRNHPFWNLVPRDIPLLREDEMAL